ncbi:hypothetical protein D9758_005486 [Tetrapyrgos nigripes]|uniref:Tetraspanin Tsp2 n=1 Tax=Tetrapyrgos nigripes TaxID=182062 RepID=A0A8H5GHX3_9AGAR|nr:hypothetical protein D9758_005486 [Tetrapyrgos nigripes]
MTGTNTNANANASVTNPNPNSTSQTHGHSSSNPISQPTSPASLTFPTSPLSSSALSTISALVPDPESGTSSARPRPPKNNNMASASGSRVSLAINYIPQKFPHPLGIAGAVAGVDRRDERRSSRATITTQASAAASSRVKRTSTATAASASAYTNMNTNLNTPEFSPPQLRMPMATSGTGSGSGLGGGSGFGLALGQGQRVSWFDQSQTHSRSHSQSQNPELGGDEVTEVAVEESTPRPQPRHAPAQGSGYVNPAARMSMGKRLSMAVSASFGGLRFRSTAAKNESGHGSKMIGLKRGGGVEAFGTNPRVNYEKRIADVGDEDYDGVMHMGVMDEAGPSGSSPTLGDDVDVRDGEVDVRGIRKTASKRKMKWNRFKVVLFCTNTLLILWSILGFIFLLLVVFDLFPSSLQDTGTLDYGHGHASILLIGNHTELAFSFLAVSFGLFTSLIGYTGILLNNRSFLAVYTFLTWVTFAFLVVPGYVTYKKREFNLEGKVDGEWSHFGRDGSVGFERLDGLDARRRIQNALGCCGWFSPYVEATITQTCYSRSTLPGCKLPYMDFQRGVLKRFYMSSFLLVPVQIVVMVVGLLCSNHVTWRFGKGMMPEAYRMDGGLGGCWLGR